MSISGIDVDSEDQPYPSNNQEEPTFIRRQETSGDDNLLGKMVHTETEAFELYNSYAIRLGFSVRKRKKRYKLKSSEVRQLNYMCSKEGFAEDYDPSETKEVDKLFTRVGCKAMIRFSKDDGMWKVSDFHPEHNHPFCKPEERQFLRLNRKVSKAHQGIIKTMKDARIGTIKAYAYLAEEVGGAQNIGFTKRDCYNFVNKEKMALFEAGDAQSLINLFKRKKIEDPMFFYSVQVDQENRMTNFFWRDGRSSLDYECFGDVVVFDTTYKTNMYNMFCAPFVGISNHWKNVLFGCVFLLDEQTTSFQWLFETFLESMGNRPPKTIFTDQCQAMTNGIRLVFPSTCHRLCLWHISLNGTKNIASYLGIPEFKKLFNKCLYGCETVEEFESNWGELLNTFNVTENTWLKKLYTIKEKWCATFNLDTFSAGIQSSQRSESINRVFHHISAANLRLVEFVQHYDKQLETTRSNDLEETFRCKNGIPSSAKRSSKLLYHAGELYSRKIYKLFESELIASMAFKMVEVDANEKLHTFELSQERSNRSYTVKVTSSNGTITCTCKMFESKGLLCCHALRVLNLRDVTKIPPQYILNRWKKDAKAEFGAQEQESVLQKKDAPSVALSLNYMVRIAYDILTTASLSANGQKIAMEKLKEMNELIEKDAAKSNEVPSHGDCVSDDNENVNPIDDVPILDPLCAKTKGMSNERWKSAAERLSKKKRSTKNSFSSSKQKTRTRVSNIPVNQDPTGPSFDQVSNSYPGSHGQYYPYFSESFPHLSSSQVIDRRTDQSKNVPAEGQSYRTAHPNTTQFYPSMNLLSANTQGNLPLSNQTYGDSNALYPPNFSFTGMLLSQQTSGSTSIPNYQFNFDRQLSQDLHSKNDYQPGSRDMAYSP